MGELPQLEIPSKLATSASPSFRLRTPSLNSVRLRRVFDLFDCDGDGEITVTEICGALDRLGLGLGADPADLNTAVSHFIRPGASGLAFDDFAAFHTALGDALFGDLCDDGAAGGEEEQEMREAFGVFDDNGDGFISARELQVVLEKLGLPDGKSIDRVQKMIGSVDENHDGQVDFIEFRHMMRNITVNAS